MNITAIRSIHFTADEKLLAYIEKKVQKLDKFHPKIIDGAVSLKLENSGQVRDKICEIKLRIPGQLLVVEGTSKSFEAACDNAVSTLKRRLVRLKDKLVQH